jgi:hypothetical protein
MSSQKRSCLLYIFLFLSLGSSLIAQTIQREKIISSIHQLTPTRHLQESFLNMDIIGFDILDRKKTPLAPSEYTFFLENKLYIVLYGKKRTPGKNLELENKFENYLIVLRNSVDGSFIRSTNTTYILGDQIIASTPGSWRIGGVYKIQLFFEIPKFARIGEYQLRFTPKKAVLQSENIFRLKDIHIDIEKRKRRVQTILNFNNLDIVGIEFQDENKKRLLNKSQPFLPGSQFYIVVHAKRIRIPADLPGENSLDNYTAEFKHEKKGSFRSDETMLFQKEKRVDTLPKEWRFGEIYRMQLRFTIPRTARPGRYKLKIIRKNAVQPMIREIRIRGAWIVIRTQMP